MSQKHPVYNSAFIDIDEGRILNGGLLSVTAKSSVTVNETLNIRGRYCIEDATNCRPSEVELRSQGTLILSSDSHVNLGRHALLTNNSGVLDVCRGAEFTYEFDPETPCQPRIRVSINIVDNIFYKVRYYINEYYAFMVIS